MDLYLTLGAAGIELADLSGRLYAGTQRMAIPDGAFLDDLGDGTVYRLALAGTDAGGAEYTFSYEYPSGVAFVERWGTAPGAVPPCVIVPFREQGLTLDALGAVLYLDGAPATSLRFLPLGSEDEPGDYALYGWPSAVPGRWLLLWSLGDILFKREWGTGAGAAGDRLDVDDRLLAAFTALWRAATPPAPLTAMPRVLPAGADFAPKNQEPFLELDLLTDKGDQWGPIGLRNFDLPGTLQISVSVQGGAGRLLATALLKIAAVCVDALQVPGLRLYGCRKPYDMPAPLSGYYSRAVDAPARYVGE